MTVFWLGGTRVFFYRQIQEVSNKVLILKHTSKDREKFELYVDITISGDEYILKKTQHIVYMQYKHFKGMKERKLNL